MRRSPMPPKREKPRRTGKPLPRIKPGRVEDPGHLARIRALPCIACEIGGTTQTEPTEAHHIRDGVGMGQRAGDHEAIPLCVWHHRTGLNSRHLAPALFKCVFGAERDLLVRTLEALKTQEAA